MILDFPFGCVTCEDGYAYFERMAGQDLSLLDAKVLTDALYKYYDKHKFVYISHRKTITQIDLDTYQVVNQKQMVGIAIVSNSIDPELELSKEQALYDGSFAFFKTLEQAIAWAKTFDLN